MKKIFTAILFSIAFLSTNAQDEFITTWETTTANESITIPINPNYAYNYTVDWGDGSTATNEDSNATHSYAAAGDHTIKITGRFPAIYFNNTGDKKKIKEINQWGRNNWKSMDFAFYGCSKLQGVATDTPDLS
ncbi:MAG: PKD domain-containing protein, partial [Flavobacteriaceae bacterium]|nr:PKD domain-containing protein [Flavobacteriaceae bacterium]